MISVMILNLCFVFFFESVKLYASVKLSIYGHISSFHLCMEWIFFKNVVQLC